MLIELNDLRHSINRALNLGRYQIVVKTAHAEQVPASITLDLLERDDDGFRWPVEREDGEPSVWQAMREVKGEKARASLVWHALQLYAHETEAPFPRSTLDWFTQRVGVRLTRSDSVATDDHGPCVPAQGAFYRSAEIVGVENGPDGPWAVREPGPKVYEFTIQSLNEAAAKCGAGPFTLDSPDLLTEAFTWMECDRGMTADWVHVYDRVTRERRTLKRPEPDAVLTGLREVARGLGKSDAVRSSADHAMRRAAVEAGYAGLDDYVAAQAPAADPLPPVGPLTSTEGLKAGDVLRIRTGLDGGGNLIVVKSITDDGCVVERGTEGTSFFPTCYEFVSRETVDTPPSSSET